MSPSSPTTTTPAPDYQDRRKAAQHHTIPDVRCHGLPQSAGTEQTHNASLCPPGSRPTEQWPSTRLTTAPLLTCEPSLKELLMTPWIELLDRCDQWWGHRLDESAVSSWIAMAPNDHLLAFADAIDRSDLSFLIDRALPLIGPGEMRPVVGTKAGVRRPRE